ncbi:MAG: DNA repair protein RecN, partial [Bacteroidia bacterium]
MITHLHVKNYALIKELNLNLGTKLNIITGETGAGKSIMLGALGLLLGNRADAKAFEYNKDKCVIEGHFNLTGLDLETYFEKEDLDYETQSILRREISKTGKSRAFINDTPVTLNVLKSLGERLVDIHSQHSNLLLKSEDFRRRFVDFMAKSQNEFDAFKKAFKIWKIAKNNLETLKQKESELRSKADFNQFQFTEINELKLEAAEYETNEHELELLNNSEKIAEAFALMEHLLDNGDGSVLEKLSEMRNAVQRLAALDPRIDEISNRINSTYLELQDLNQEANGLKDEWIFDEQRLGHLNERQDKIQRLLRKHNVETIEELLLLEQQFKSEFAQAEDFENEIKKLENLVAKNWIAVVEKGKKLSAKRKSAAQKIGPEISLTLKQLGIPDGELKIEINTELHKVNEKSGFDQFNFLFSANKGIELQDVSKVASGGEISRIMLALKAFMSESNQFPTLIFDEIDRGIGGATADAVGRRLVRLSQNAQILTVTHSPQVAA